MSKFLDETGLSQFWEKIKLRFLERSETAVISVLDIDSTPTSNSTNLVTSGGVKTALDSKANKSEMSVVAGTGANADKTTITLKNGTSATVLTSHQDISGKADKATTLAGYGITDAKIANGTITLGNNTITPVTAVDDGSISNGRITINKANNNGQYGLTTLTDTVENVSNKALTPAALYSFGLSVSQALNGKLDTLVSGTNIKTINNESLLGSGNITISAGSNVSISQSISVGTSATIGSTTYDIVSGSIPSGSGATFIAPSWAATMNLLKLSNDYVPSVLENEDLELSPNDTYEVAFGKLHKAILDNELITSASLIDLNSRIPTNVSDLLNDSGFITSYTETDPTVLTWAKSPIIISGNNNFSPSILAFDEPFCLSNTSIKLHTTDSNHQVNIATILGTADLTYNLGGWEHAEEDSTLLTMGAMKLRFALKDSPAFTGTPTAPTASSGTNTTQIATTAFVQDAISDKVDKVTSTDNAIVRFDGTGGAIQNSGVTINDNNHVTAAKFITSGGTSSQFVKGNGSLDSSSYATRDNAVCGGDYITNSNSANTGSTKKDIFINHINDRLYAANSRFYVTHKVFDSSDDSFVKDLSTNVFSGNLEQHGNTISEGQYAELYIGTEPEATLGTNSSMLWTYGNEVLYLTFYPGRYPDSIDEAKLYHKYSPAGWDSCTITKISSAVYKIVLPNKTYPAAIKIKWSGSSSRLVSLSDVKAFGGRSTLNTEGVVTKYGIKQDLWGDVEAPKFIKRGGTSSQFLKADGSVDSTTYQAQLVSGTNIKTINNESILGSGNITIQGSGGDTNVIETVKVNGTALTPDANKVVDITSVPASIVTQDATHRFVSDTEKSTWNGKLNALQHYSEPNDDAQILVYVDNTGEGSGSNGEITLSCIDEMLSAPLAELKVSRHEGINLYHEYYDSSLGIATLSQNVSIDDYSIKLNYYTFDNLGHEVELNTAGFKYDNKQIATIDQIPSAVTESTVSGWGFTKNTGTITGVSVNNTSVATSGVANITVPVYLDDLQGSSSSIHVSQDAFDAKGTYSKPSGGIPKTDLATAVQTSLGLADTALQPSAIVDNTSFSSEHSKAPSGYAVSAALQGKADTATTLAGYGITDAKIANGVITLGSNSITPLTNHLSIKTINNNTITGTGNITIATPGILKSDNTTAQTTANNESLSGTVNLHKISKTGNYNDLIDKPTIPSAVTESTVSGWGFTKNAGTITSVTGSNGLTGSGSSGSVTISHAAPSTSPAKSTSAVYPITIDQYGHITSAGTAVTIPTQVTESTVSGWGFTKNVGTVTSVEVNGTTASLDAGGCVSIDAITGVEYASHPITATNGVVDILTAILTEINAAKVTIYSGTAAPSNSLGTNGDLYLQTS